MEMDDVTYVDFDKNVFRQLANCFSKGYTVQLSSNFARQKKDQKKTQIYVLKRADKGFVSDTA